MKLCGSGALGVLVREGKRVFRIIEVWLILSLFAPAGLQAAGRGPLVIAGGGQTPRSVLRTFLELGGGSRAVVAVVPQASNRPDRGTASVEVFLELGAAEAGIVELDDPKTARGRLETATAIWFPGGSQARLFDALKGAGLVKSLRARHQAGVALGGSSAGAAIMSKVMITSAPKTTGLRVGNTPVATGLGLADRLIIDQHFVARRRMNRLLGAVLDHPKWIGVGIGESTAIVVQGGRFRVLGDASVVVMDARAATTGNGKLGSLQSGTGLVVHVLKAGDAFRFVEPEREK